MEGGRKSRKYEVGSRKRSGRGWEVGSQMSATSRKQFGMPWRPIRTCYEQRAIFQVTPPNVPRGAARPAISHHPWLIGKNEQEEHGEVTRPDQELAEEKKEKEPVKLSRLPDPVSNDTKHRHRLEDDGDKIQAVGIVELAKLIMMRQPAAAVKKAIHPDGADQGNRGINDRLGFQKSEVSGSVLESRHLVVGCDVGFSALVDEF